MKRIKLLARDYQGYFAFKNFRTGDSMTANELALQLNRQNEATEIIGHYDFRCIDKLPRYETL